MYRITIIEQNFFYSKFFMTEKSPVFAASRIGAIYSSVNLEFSGTGIFFYSYFHCIAPFYLFFIRNHKHLRTCLWRFSPLVFKKYFSVTSSPFLFILTTISKYYFNCYATPFFSHQVGGRQLIYLPSLHTNVRIIRYTAVHKALRILQ